MLLSSLRVGLFLAVRYVRRSSVWSTLLIVFVMFLTFLNVVVVRGILVGLPLGAEQTYQSQYSGDILVRTLPDRDYIDQTVLFESVIPTISGYRAHSSRYIGRGVVEANYRDQIRKEFERRDEASAVIVGIDPVNEDQITQLSDLIVEGQALNPDDTQFVLLAHLLIDRFDAGTAQGATISDVFPGDKVRISTNENTREYTVKGIVKGKANETAQRVYMIDSEARKLTNRFDRNVGEIAIRINNTISPEQFRDQLLASGLGAFGEIETSRESLGQFLEDITQTFEILSSLIGVIGVAVASITVFIVIFIFAIARQKEIGILKGIGISNFAIISSYVFLAFFYAILGIAFGTFVLYGFLQPYIVENPIDFPFADGILVAAVDDTVFRMGIILVATLFAGYVPARLIVQKNTINAILGR